MAGLLTENGPYMTNDGKTLTKRPVSWADEMAYIALDQPAGAGYSYTTGPSVTNEEDIGTQAAHAIGNIMAAYPTVFGNRDLYLAGESYAGSYIPSIAAAIINNSTSSLAKQLKGIAVGDGLTDCALQVECYSAWSFEHGLVSGPQAQKMDAMAQTTIASVKAQDWSAATNGFFSTMNVAAEASGLNVYDIRDAFGYDDTLITAYLNQASVKSALNVPASVTWAECVDSLYMSLFDDICKSKVPQLKTALANIRVLYFSGLQDLIIPVSGTDNLLKQVVPAIDSAPRSQWMAQDDAWGTKMGICGYSRSSGSLTHVVKCVSLPGLTVCRY